MFDLELDSRVALNAQESQSVVVVLEGSLCESLEDRAGPRRFTASQHFLANPPNRLG